MPRWPERRRDHQRHGQRAILRGRGGLGVRSEDGDGSERVTVGATNNTAGKPQAGKATARQSDVIDFDAMSDEDLGIRPMRSYAKVRVEWDLENRIVKRAYNLIAGEGKQGKTQVLGASRPPTRPGAKSFPDSSALPKGKVLFLSAEDDPSRTLRPRLEALGADVDQILIMEARFKILAGTAKRS